MESLVQGGAAPAVDDAALLAALRECGGHTGFRAGQLDAIRATLDRRDSLLILPTGGGKSLTFQLPPVARGNCFTVVISPLLALAFDQVEKCNDNGVEAALWNSTISDMQRSAVLSELASDEPTLRLLYTTPESLLKPALRDALKEAHASGTLCAFAIDEAHCISEWGHDFRPAYLQLASLKTDFPGVPIAALTASIVSCLGLKDPCIITASFNRPNIELTVRHKALIGGGTEDDVIEDLLAFIAERPGQCGIVYARLRSTCDRLASVLSGADVDCAKYHAGLDTGQRSKVMHDWAEGSVDVVVATIAFGMGIDRSDVRWVVHYNLPSSVEGFYQEAGRAGRDGAPSVSLVYESVEDAETVGRMERANRQGSMATVADLMTSPGCRRKRLLAFFKEQRGPCDASHELPCDWCADPTAVRRRLAEREAHVGARLEAARRRELGLDDDDARAGSSGGGDGNGGSNGSDDEGRGGGAKSGDENGADVSDGGTGGRGKKAQGAAVAATGGGWESAALLGRRMVAGGTGPRRPLLSVGSNRSRGALVGAAPTGAAAAPAVAAAAAATAGDGALEALQPPSGQGETAAASTIKRVDEEIAQTPVMAAAAAAVPLVPRLPGLLPRLHKRPRGLTGAANPLSGSEAVQVSNKETEKAAAAIAAVEGSREVTVAGTGAAAVVGSMMSDDCMASAAAAVQPHPLAWRQGVQQSAGRRAFKPPLRRAP